MLQASKKAVDFTVSGTSDVSFTSALRFSIKTNAAQIKIHKSLENSDTEIVQLIATNARSGLIFKHKTLRISIIRNEYSNIQLNPTLNLNNSNSKNITHIAKSRIHMIFFKRYIIGLKLKHMTYQ